LYGLCEGLTMNGGKKGRIVHRSHLGVTGEHVFKERIEFNVSPSTSRKETENTIKLGLQVVACWKAEDLCFDFDKPFVRPDTRDELEDFARHYNKLVYMFEQQPAYWDTPRPPVSIFGHADPVGKDPYNKTLSENRAKVIYGVLTRDVDKWKEVFKTKQQVSDLQESLHKALEEAPEAVHYDPGPAKGTMDGQTEQAIRDYMNWLCGDFVLEKTDFLGDGEHAYQGCSEFNPLLMFSKDEEKELERRGKKEARNLQNQPNRRVVTLMFAPGTKSLAVWPCPKAPDVQGCKDRFWSDAPKRRTFQEERREYEETHDTFACRFYERLVGLSPCEVVQMITPRIAFEGNMYYWKILEDIEIRGRKGKVGSYVEAELQQHYQELKDKNKISGVSFEQFLARERSRLTALVRCCYSEYEERGKKRYRVTATVVELRTKNTLFQAAVEADHRIGVEGWWYSMSPSRSKLQVWRQIPAGGKPSDYEHTKVMAQTKGLDEEMQKLYDKLRGEFASITERVKAELKWDEM
jgi:hypothetical protein